MKVLCTVSKIWCVGNRVIKPPLRLALKNSVVVLTFSLVLQVSHMYICLVLFFLGINLAEVQRLSSLR